MDDAMRIGRALLASAADALIETDRCGVKRRVGPRDQPVLTHQPLQLGMHIHRRLARLTGVALLT
ncbi:hypothetical protein DFO80_13341 [Rhodobacter sp. 140A]|jgi:hypothetical protein|uniref:Uncharacterized protein n=1 Tax=Paenirhodobacter hankyongi TaxID=2294033 RepID=A0A421BJC2_9RHOB|nr:hypothetical protein [Sinirhodobacter hankyongi]RBP83353.1 hypothetical protein DFO80_13341 [Rhodobacter sp. 140A]RLL61994.1 hypothetical protein DYS74_17540 [Sinirhodobacter hankyongi]